MALPSITLNADSLLLLEKETKTGIDMSTPNVLFAEIQVIGSGVTGYIVGDYITYRPANAIVFYYDNARYVVITTADICFIEN